MPFLSASFSYDQRPLKKHGGSKVAIDKPDVYPQQPNQKEDHFYSHVKMGFQNPPLDDEHKQANKKAILANRENILKSILEVKQKRDEHNNTGASNDSRKKFLLNKDRFWPYHYRVKPQLTSWMNDLSSPTKDLFQLGRRIPSFQRKEELLFALAEHKVPMVRAIWTIKLDAHHKSSQKEEISKKKSRGGSQGPDIGNDWTHAVCLFMSNLYKRMLDHELKVNLLERDENYHQQSSFWTYTTRLVKCMFEEGLLDKHEFLLWLLQAIQCELKPPDDPFNKIFIPLIYGYLDEIVQSEPLSRRLAFFCARNLTLMYENSLEAAVLSSLSPNTAALNPDARWLQQQQMHIMSSLSHRNVWEDYLQCGHHKAMMMSLSCALHLITLCCPSALIWVVPRSQVELLSPPLPQTNEDGTEQIPLQIDEGSPLDNLAVSPSDLPLPFSEQDGPEITADVKDQLVYAEELIRNRSMAIEQRWSSAKYQESSFGNEIQRVLEIIEQLDIFDFHQSSVDFNMKTLFMGIFKKTSHPSPSTNAAARALNKSSDASDWLIVKTLCDWATSCQRPGCHRAAVVANLLSQYQLWVESQDPAGAKYPYICQKHITKFLDEFAPALNNPPGHESNTFEEERTFAALVLLMHELIDSLVFSHDHYMRLLISRGDLMTGALYQMLDSSDDFSAEDNSGSAESELISDFKSRRHLLYALHFPVCRENSNDVNQRLMLLYGFGPNRERALQPQNAVMRELSAILTSPANSMPMLLDQDCFKEIRQSFLKLCFNDRQNVVAQCFNQVSYQLDCVVEFGVECGTPLPPVKAIDFIMQLSESAACVSLVLDIAENMLTSFPSMVAVLPTDYISSLLMTAVSAIETFIPYMLINDEMSNTVFESVQTAVSCLEDNPSSCSSAERCLLHLLERLVTSSYKLKQSVQPPDKYDQILNSLNQTPAVPKSQESRPQSSSASEDSFIAKSFLENPADVDEEAMCELIGRVHSKENFRSVLISTALIKLCDLKDSEKIQKANDLSLLCVEVTSRVPFLKSDWFTALTIICSQKPCGVNKTLDNLIKKINIEQTSVYDCVVVFLCHMVSRHLFKLEEVFVKLIHFILAILNENSDSSGQEREIAASTRLCMYVLLKLLHANQELDCLRLNVCEHVYSEPDRLMLAVQMRPVNVGLLVAILKAFATHVPITTNADDDDYRKPSQFESIWTSEQVLDFVGSANLQEVACAVLHALASCTWITYSCLRNPGVLKADEILLDPIGGERLASHILQLLCYPGSPVKGCRYTKGSSVVHVNSPVSGADEQQELKLRRIFENLNKWNHRSSWLQFTIILELCEWKKQMDLFNLLARLSIQIFDIQPVVELRSSQRRVPKSAAVDKQPQSESGANSNAGDNSAPSNSRDPEQAWLVAPLIGQLPAAVQGAVLNQASSMLDRGGVLGGLGQNLAGSGIFSGGLGSSSKPRSDKEKTAQKSIQLLSHGPFLSLILTCLKGQDDQRESLLSSLQTQFSQMIKEQQHIISMTSNNNVSSNSGLSLEEIQANRMKMFNDEWQLRLSLLGSMFDSILRNQSLSMEWIMTLVNLLEKDIINPVDNAQLFYTVVDMLIVLMEFNSADHPSADEQAKKMYNSIVKKIRNSIGEKQNEGLRLVRQLLPLQRSTVDVVCCEPIRSQYDSKGNKMDALSSQTRHQGNQVVGKQRLSPWDLIEGFKMHAPLQLNWFNAVKMEKGRGSVYEEQARTMFYHDHSPLDRTQSYFMQPIVSSHSAPGSTGGAGLSDEDEVQMEPPPSVSVPTPTSAAPKTKSRSHKSNSSGGTKKQTKSRKKSSQAQSQNNQLSSGPQSVLAPNMPPPTPLAQQLSQSYPGSVLGQQVGAAMQNPHSVVQQQPTNRFPPPHNAAAQAGGGGAGGMMVQNVGSQPPSQVQPQVYFQQPQQQPQSQTMSNMAMTNQAQLSMQQMSLGQQGGTQQLMAPPPQQQATPRQQLTKHLKNKNQQQAGVAAVMRAQNPQGVVPGGGGPVMPGGATGPSRMAVPQQMYRQGFAGGDSQVGFVGQTGKPPGPGPSMMSGAPTGSQSQQQMVYAVQPQNQVMSQQAQHNQPSGGQFVGPPQGVQNYTRFNSQQQMQLMLQQQQRQRAMQLHQQQQQQQGGQFGNQPQYHSGDQQQTGGTFMRGPPPYN